MAVFFGGFSRTAGSASHWVDKAEAVMGDNKKVSHMLMGRSFLTWVDLGIWASESSSRSADRIAVLAGDPVMHANNCRVGVTDALGLLASSQADIEKLLQSSCGTFCGVAGDTATGKLYLFTDKLGVRPVYLADTDQGVFFASALWVLEKLLPELLTPDPVGIAETAAMGFPLADRSPYLEVKVLFPAEIVSVSDGRIERHLYFDWNSILRAEYSEVQLLDAIDQRMTEAIQDRRSNRKETAFLSGGMDSRLIVAKLVETGAEVSTLNFAPSGTQDLVLGALASHALGTTHFEFPLGPADFGDKQVDTIRAWLSADPRAEFNNKLWSGDGGSVGLGHVYLNQEIIDSTHKTDPEKTSGLILGLNKWLYPSRLLKQRWRHLADSVPANTAKEISRWTAQPDKAPYLFLMTNDQRRHLAAHFERVHEKGFDFLLPFFDSRFIELVVSAPTEHLLSHRVYNKLLLALPGDIARVPWQAYPGHDPCPIPAPAGLRYQWEACYDEKDSRSIVIENAKACLTMAVSSTSTPVSRFKLFLAWGLTRLGVRDQSYYARYAKPFFRYY